ncbi:MAG: ImpA family metalloprotease [Thiolinea sp.]
MLSFLRLLPILFLLMLTTVRAEVRLETKVLLQGAYDPSSGLMRDDLRRKGYLPLSQPYQSAPFTYAGKESLSEQLLLATDDTAPVDWVLVELRDMTDATLIYAQQAAVLRRDGHVVDPATGNTALHFRTVKPGSYQIGIQHRNHLGVVSADVFSLSEESQQLIDFSDQALAVVGENARHQASGQPALLWAGDVDASTRMIASGPDTDSGLVLAQVLTEPGNRVQSANFRLNGYANTDLNLDGATVFAGPGNDVNLLQANVLSHPGNSSFSNNYIVKGRLPSLDRMRSALMTGNAKLISDDNSLLDEALSALAELKQTPALLQTLYGEQAITYDPGNRTQLIRLQSWVDGVYPIVQGNKGEVLAMAGEKSAARFAAFGSIPTEYFQQNENLSFQEPFKRLLLWLQRDESAALTAPRTLALSFAGGDKNDFKNWIQANIPAWSVVDCNAVAELVSCYAGADLIITGWQGDESEAQAIRDVLADELVIGKPVLYLHTWYEAYNAIAHAIADLLHFSLPYGGNYWAKDAANWTDAATMQESIWSEQGAGSIEVMLQHFKATDYAFDWQDCSGSCPDTGGFKSGFDNGAKKVRSIMTGLDQERLDIFQTQGSARWVKLLALLGDQYRQQIQLPMDKNTTDQTVFLKALFADHAVYNYRDINPVQSDMGNFSRSDFSHITPVDQVINLTSKRNFRSTGLYALPGQTFRVTRNDDSPVNTTVFVNTQRSGSTHEFENNGYKRPKFLQTPKFTISHGETIRLTTPYGGPIQIGFDSNDQAVEFSFENVGEHPYWNSAEDDASFAQQLAQGDYDWAELVTPGFEVHSTLEKMRQSMNDAKWGSAQALAEATSRYVHNFPHVLAGFQGPGIDVVPEIHDFAAAHGYTIDNLDMVKHMNADQATCGYGCSGNPYDAYWAFSPVGHGDIHELGHGLEKSRLRFDGWETHTMTNPYSYYTKSQYYKDTGGEPECQSLPFQRMFDVLQASVDEADPAVYVKSQLWDSMGWSEGAGMMIQMMMAAQDNGSLQDGWHLLARLHIMEREYQRAIKSEDSWTAKRNSLGFSQYTLSAVKAMSVNDWLLVAVSHATQRDHTDYFTLWALDYSAAAGAQVAAMNLPVVAREYFVSSGTGYCKGEGFDGMKVQIDGQQSWPQ